MKGISNDVPWRGQGDVLRVRHSDSGKGDASRPTPVGRKTFEENWERTFGKPAPDDNRSQQ